MLHRRVLLRKTGSQDLTGGVALALTSVFPGNFKLLMVLLHASENITETVSVHVDSKDGANYDTELATSNLSAADDYVFRPTGECILQQGDQIKVACTAANTTGIVYATIIAEDLGKQA